MYKLTDESEPTVQFALLLDQIWSQEFSPLLRNLDNNLRTKKFFPNSDTQIRSKMLKTDRWNFYTFVITFLIKDEENKIGSFSRKSSLLKWMFPIT